MINDRERKPHAPTRAPLVWLILALVFGVLLAPTFGQTSSCQRNLLNAPQTYDKYTERYYLAWIAHGDEGQRAVASLSLLELDGRTEYDLVHKLWKCESEPVIENALLLALFDQKPDDHLKAVKELVPYGSDLDGWPVPNGATIKLKSLPTGNPKSFDEYIKQGYLDYHFDWGRTAAARLAKKGFLSDRVFDSVLSLASSPTLYASRQKAKEIFDLIEGIPSYDPSPKEHLDGLPGALPRPIPAGLEQYEKARLEQVKTLRKWYDRNKKKLKWDKAKRRYLIEG